MMHIDSSEPIVKPIRGKNPPLLGRRAVMVSNGQDLDQLRQILHVASPPIPLMMSQIWRENKDSPRYTLLGPVVCAAYAVMLLEPIRVWGIEEVVFFGWCGSLSAQLRIGDVLVADAAIVDEGTSPAYGSKIRGTASPSASLAREVTAQLTQAGISFHQGLVWSTDAIYRETRRKVDYFRHRGAIAVEMELSAIFAASAALGIRAAGLLVVSDSLASGKWQPGFKHPEFIQNRKNLASVLAAFCAKG